MTEPEIMFRAMVLFTFVVSAVNHWLIPRGTVSRTLIIIMLCGFIYTEGYLALTVDWSMWAYVSLNCWGLWNFWKTRVSGAEYWRVDITITPEDTMHGLVGA